MNLCLPEVYLFQLRSNFIAFENINLFTHTHTEYECVIFKYLISLYPSSTHECFFFCFTKCDELWYILYVPMPMFIEKFKFEINFMYLSSIHKTNNNLYIFDVNLSKGIVIAADNTSNKNESLFTSYCALVIHTLDNIVTFFNLDSSLFQVFVWISLGQTTKLAQLVFLLPLKQSI